MNQILITEILFQVKILKISRDCILDPTLKNLKTQSPYEKPKLGFETAGSSQKLLF